MIDNRVRMVLAASLCASLVWMLQAQKAPAPASAVPSTKNGEWPMYTADLRGSKYSPLDQIDAANFNKLQVAWTFKTDGLSPRTEAKLEALKSDILTRVFAMILGSLVVNIVALVGAMFGVAKLLGH